MDLPRTPTPKHTEPDRIDWRQLNPVAKHHRACAVLSLREALGENRGDWNPAELDRLCSLAVDHLITGLLSELLSNIRRNETR